MSDISDLKASVLEQAHEKGSLLLAEATEKIEQEAKEREAQLVRQKLGQREQQLKDQTRRSCRRSLRICRYAPWSSPAQ